MSLIQEFLSWLEGTITTRRPQGIDWYLKMVVGVAGDGISPLLYHGHPVVGCISTAEELASHPLSSSEAHRAVCVAWTRPELGDRKRPWTWEERERERERDREAEKKWESGSEREQRRERERCSADNAGVPAGEETGYIVCLGKKVRRREMNIGASTCMVPIRDF